MQISLISIPLYFWCNPYSVRAKWERKKTEEEKDEEKDDEEKE